MEVFPGDLNPKGSIKHDREQHHQHQGMGLLDKRVFMDCINDDDNDYDLMVYCRSLATFYFTENN